MVTNVDEGTKRDIFRTMFLFFGGLQENSRMIPIIYKRKIQRVTEECRIDF